MEEAKNFKSIDEETLTERMEDLTEEYEEPYEIEAWGLIKKILAFASGAAAAKLVSDILSELAAIPNASKFTRTVYAVGVLGISGAVGTAITRYTEEDLSGFDTAVKIIHDYRKEVE